MRRARPSNASPVPTSPDLTQPQAGAGWLPGGLCRPGTACGRCSWCPHTPTGPTGPRHLCHRREECLEIQKAESGLGSSGRTGHRPGKEDGGPSPARRQAQSHSPEWLLLGARGQQRKRKAHPQMSFNYSKAQRLRSKARRSPCWPAGIVTGFPTLASSKGMLMSPPREPQPPGSGAGTPRTDMWKPLPSQGLLGCLPRHCNQGKGTRRGDGERLGAVAAARCRRGPSSPPCGISSMSHWGAGALPGQAVGGRAQGWPSRDTTRATFVTPSYPAATSQGVQESRRINFRDVFVFSSGDPGPVVSHGPT